jgi:hypothetical protein
MRLVQQLAIGMQWPGLQQQQQQQHPGAALLLSRPASVTLTAMHSARHCWRAWGGALQDSLAGCRAAAQRVQAAMGGGALACQWLATLLLGLLLYHAQQGLLLLPIAAASLALAASGRMAAAAAAAASAGGGGSSHSRSECLPVWPAQCAAAVFAAHCLVLALLRPLAAGLAARLLAGTPALAALVLLLLAGQVVLGVLCAGGKSSAAELRHASLLCRCWFVAAVGVLLGACSTASSVAGVLAAAAAWAQKSHMLLVEGPLLVMQLEVLLQPSGTPARAAAAHSAAGASSSTALLCCLHCLLQLLVVLFVPPAPLAAAAWLPQLLQGLLVWGARVLLCGCCMQLALRGFRSSHDCGSTPAAALSAAEAPADGTGPSSSRRRRAAGVRQLRLTAAAAASDRSCFDSCLSSPVGLNNSSLRQRSSGGDPPAPWLPLSPPLATYHRSPQHAHSGSPGISSPSPVHCWDLRLPDHDGGSNNEPATLSLFRQPPGGTLVMAPTEDVSSSAAGACVAALAHAPAGRLLKQHAAYLVVLAAAFAGDSFITAAAAGGGGGGPAAVHGAAGAWAVRLAWHRVVRGALVAALGVELCCAVSREAVLWKALWASRHTGWPSMVWQAQAQQQFRL